MTGGAAADGPAALAGAVAGFGFPEMVRLLELLGTPARPTGTTGRLAEEAVLFRAAPSLGFPAGELHGLSTEGDGPGGLPSLAVNFLGLYGPSSPLPSFWTERIVMETEGAQNLRDFLDVFNHPAIALAYRILRHYRVDLDVSAEASDRMSRAVLAVAGLSPEMMAAGPLEAARLLPWCGLLAQFTRSAGVMEAVLAGYLDVPVRVEEFVPRRVEIPRDQQMALGGSAAVLGETAVLGPCTSDMTGAVRVILGPLDSATFAEFLPGGARRPVLDALVRLVLREPLECQVTLALEAAASDRFVPGDTRLGWTSWLTGPAKVRACPAGGA